MSRNGRLMSPIQERGRVGFGAKAQHPCGRGEGRVGTPCLLLRARSSCGTDCGSEKTCIISEPMGCKRLRYQQEELHKRVPGSILLVNGSDEGISLLIQDLDVSVYTWHKGEESMVSSVVSSTSAKCVI